MDDTGQTDQPESITADELTAQANALYEQALTRRREEAQAVQETEWQTAGIKADAYWDLMDAPALGAYRTPRPEPDRSTWPPGPAAPPWTPYTAAELALAACDLADGGGTYEAAAGALYDLARRSNLPPDVLHGCLGELEGLRSP